jgi:hypothetical protein
MSDLVVWLRQQLDTDERLARSVEPVPRQRWEAVSGEWGPQVRTERGSEPHWSHEIQAEVWRCDDEMDGCPDIARAAMAEAEFIAANDPDRVLRQVQAHKAILGEHEGLANGACNTCSEGMFSGEHQVYPCRTIKALVSIYSDRDGYQEEWNG